MDRVTRNLHIGDARDGADEAALRAAGITAVVRFTHTPPAEPLSAEFVVDSIPLLDGPQNEYESFREAADTLRARLTEGHTVLAHCAAGSSRSVAVAAAAVATRGGLPLAEVVAEIRASRPVADPHRALLAQAERYLRER
jgi:protein-tyrosine phosphatase